MNQHLQDITEIRSMMERSSRFISLSGLAGIFAGTFALVGASLGYLRIMSHAGGDHIRFMYDTPLLRFVVMDAVIVLVLSRIFAVYFTSRQARKKGLKMWDSTSKRLLINMAIPLIAGGLFCLILLRQAPHLVDAATLIFYGLACVNASKYTLDDIRYLGYAEIILGLISGCFIDWRIGLLCWAIGFGVLHIFYGIVMYRKYES
jgi:hypothetical protein